MKATRAVGLFIDLLLLAVSLSTGGNLGNALQIIGLVVAGVALALAIALLVLLTIVLIDQRRPPYPMDSGGSHG